MKIHLTPAFEVTLDTIEIHHLYNTQEERVYSMDFLQPTPNHPKDMPILNMPYHDALTIIVPNDLSRPIHFYRNGCDEEYGPAVHTTRIDHEDGNVIKQLFYEFCHKHTDKNSLQKYAYVYDIEWQDTNTDKRLPNNATVDVSGMGNIRNEIKGFLQHRFGKLPVNFKMIEYTPYEEPHIGVIFTHHPHSRYEPQYTCYICEPNNGQITCTSFEICYEPDTYGDLMKMLETYKKQNHEPEIKTLENNQLLIPKDDSCEYYSDYYVTTKQQMCPVSMDAFTMMTNILVTQK